MMTTPITFTDTADVEVTLDPKNLFSIHCSGCGEMVEGREPRYRVAITLGEDALPVPTFTLCGVCASRLR